MSQTDYVIVGAGSAAPGGAPDRGPRRPRHGARGGRPGHRGGARSRPRGRPGAPRSTGLPTPSPGAPGRSTMAARPASAAEQPQRDGLHPREPAGLGRAYDAARRRLPSCAVEDVPRRPGVPRPGGPIEPRPAPPPISVAFVEAAREKGYPVTRRTSTARTSRAPGFHDLLIKDGRRTSAARHRTCTPRAGRPNLEVVDRGARGKGAPAPAIAAPGVEYVRDGATRPGPGRARGRPRRRRAIDSPGRAAAVGDRRRRASLREAGHRAGPSTCPASGATCTTTC